MNPNEFIDRRLDRAARKALEGLSAQPSPDFLNALLAETPKVTVRPQPNYRLQIAAGGLVVAGAAAGGLLLARSDRDAPTPISGTNIATRRIPTNAVTTHPSERRVMVRRGPTEHRGLTPSVVATAARPLPDSEFLDPGRNGVPKELGGTGGPGEHLDDRSFISSSPTLYADAIPPTAEEILADQELKQQEVKEVDARLYRNVSLSLKHGSFDEVCEALSKQTGVEITAARNVRYDNATIFVTARPAREVMREISRVFGCTWERDGKQDSYSYTMRQTSESQVAEEKQRNDDVSRAMQKLFEQVRISSTAPDSPGQQDEFGWPDGKTQTNSVSRAVDKAFVEMAPDELSRLQGGEEVTLSSDTHRQACLDPSASHAILLSMGGVHPFADNYMAGGREGDPGYESYLNMKDPEASVTYRLHLTEFGGVNLSMLVGASGIWSKGSRVGAGAGGELAEVPGVSEAPPENTRDNKDLAGTKGMDRQISIKPTPTTPVEKQGVDPEYPTDHMSMDIMNGGFRTRKPLQPPHPYMTSDDYWQAVHDATGMDVVCDSFSRLFSLHPLGGTTFQVLNKGCDEMHYRWRLDEKFLTGRSVSHAWQRLNEVPKRMLTKWAAERQSKSALSLRSVLEMSQLTDRQLNSIEVGKTIYHQWGMKEWAILSRPLQKNAYEVVRPLARFLSDLDESELEMAEGARLQVHALTAPMQRRMAIPGTGYDGGLPSDALLGVSYVPAGTWFWCPFFEMGKEPVHGDLFTGKTKEEVEAKVRAAYGACHLEEIYVSNGQLGLMVIRGTDVNQMGDGHFGVGWKTLPE